MPYSQESFGSGSYELEVEVLCWGEEVGSEEGLDIQKKSQIDRCSFRLRNSATRSFGQRTLLYLCSAA